MGIVVTKSKERKRSEKIFLDPRFLHVIYQLEMLADCHHFWRKFWRTFQRLLTHLAW